ncbi:MAG: hypothetical protein AAFR65_14420 [Pseudomonadota bacterium]
MNDRPPRLIVAIAGALTMQTIAALLWAGAAAERLSQLELERGRLTALEVRAARLEEQTDHLRTTLARIEQKLDRALLMETAP